MLTIDQRSKLTPAQIVIAEKWLAEGEQYEKLFERLEIAIKNGNAKAYDTAMDELGEMTPSVCEHSRSIWEECSECDAIERIIRPQLFEANGDRQPIQDEIEP